MYKIVLYLFRNMYLILNTVRKENIKNRKHIRELSSFITTHTVLQGGCYVFIHLHNDI